MVHVPLVSTSSQIIWKMVLNIDNLSHVFHIISHPLATLAIPWATGSKLSNVVWHVLIFWSRTLQRVEVELILIGSATYTPLVWLLGHLVLLTGAVSWIINALSWVSELVELSTVDGHRLGVGWDRGTLSAWRVGHLVTVPTGLWPAFNVVLNLLLLLFIGVTDLYALTDLSLLRPIERVECSSSLLRRALSIHLAIINVRIVDPIPRPSLQGAGPWPSFSSDPPLSLPRGVIDTV